MRVGDFVGLELVLEKYDKLLNNNLTRVDLPVSNFPVNNTWIGNCIKFLYNS